VTKHSADFDQGFRHALDAAAFAIEGFADATQKNFIEATKPLPEPLREFTQQLEPAVKGLIESSRPEVGPRFGRRERKRNRSVALAHIPEKHTLAKARPVSTFRDHAPVSQKFTSRHRSRGRRRRR
jgi:hypothetical protein